MDLREIVSVLKTERARLDRAIASLETSQLDGRRRRGRPAKSAKITGGGITAAGRKRISVAMKRRWAERRIQTVKAATPTSTVSTKKRGGVSAAGRKRLSEMMKKRWAERRKKVALQ
jgi:hypothetical protein